MVNVIVINIVVSLKNQVIEIVGFVFVMFMLKIEVEKFKGMKIVVSCVRLCIFVVCCDFFFVVVSCVNLISIVFEDVY